MGVLNVTPDSFSDGGQWFDHAAATAHGLAMIAAGANVIDVGGESTRPGAEPVDAAQEIERVIPVIDALAAHGRISVDTRKPEVAEAAIGAGATLVNDVTATLWPVAAEAGVGWVAMHMRGDPRTMQGQAEYDDVVAEVTAFLDEKAAQARQAGVSEIWIDPGIGFAKTAAHNLALLKHLDELVATGWPVVIGTSRKSFLGRLASREQEPPAPVHDRLEGSLASTVWAALQGAAMVRVHDVAATVAAIRIMEAPVTA
jgi:dihydropteroate synthase